MTPFPVAVLYGGPSSEREISRRTAAAVIEALPRDHLTPIPVEVSADTRWSVDGGPFGSAADALEALRARGVRVVFPALHGYWGEDGRIQGFLEVAGLPYVGSGVLASALAMDKARAREVLAAHGMPLPRALEFRGGSPAAAARAVREELGLPAVVKSPVGGSSLEVRIVKEPETLEAEIAARIRAPGGRALVEEYLEGTELTCPVLGNASVGGELTALPLVRIRLVTTESFTTEAKYDPDAVVEECPARVPEDLAERVRELAVLAHRVLGCDGLTRSDFLAPAGGDPRFLELNTLPGLTAASLSPKSAAAAGIPFPELLLRLVRLALERRETGRVPPAPGRAAP